MSRYSQGAERRVARAMVVAQYGPVENDVIAVLRWMRGDHADP